MISINEKNTTYILCVYILDNAPIYSKEVRNTRDLINKKCIQSTELLYAKLKNNIWIVSDGKSAKFDKVFMKKSFVDSIPEINYQIILSKTMMVLKKHQKL